MSKQETLFTAQLNEAAVDRCSETVRNYLNAKKIDKRDVSRYALSVEEILLKTMDADNEERNVSVFHGKKFFRSYIGISVSGSAANVFAHSEREGGIFGSAILRNLGLSPDYTYLTHDEENQYLFSYHKKQISPLLTLIIAFAAAILVGVLGLLLPADTLASINNGLMEPLHTTFLNILSCIAGPMIFLSVAWGIYGIGDAAALKRIGKNMMLSFFLTILAGVVVLTGLTLPFFDLDFSQTSGATSQLSSIFQMILDIIPKNIFSPFVSGNTLQIIFLAIVIGIAMLFLGKKTKAVAIAVEQINYLVQFLIEFISRLVPFFIFIVVVRMIWSDTFKILANVAKYFIVFASALILFGIALVLISSWRNRANPWVLIKKGIPTFLIAFTTASSAAAFGANMKACKNKYGIDDMVSSFGIPLGMVTFKPGTAMCLLTTSLYFAEISQVHVSAAWIIVMIFTVVLLSLATPPIPGGALTTYTVLFAQLGIPAELLAVALACDVVVDFFSTGCNQFLLPFPLISQAARMDLINRNVLTKK